jgi:hypothetical protein
LELLQTKHHIGRPTNLTDSSADLWKTLRVWSDYIGDGQFAEGTLLYLITTAHAAPDSVASLLGATARDEETALHRLRAIAATSASSHNRPAYQAFNNLNGYEQRLLVSAIQVLDGAPDMRELDRLITKMLKIAVPRRHLEPFQERLEGWWLRRCLSNLSAGPDQSILAEELGAELDELRSQFEDESLPIDDDVRALVADTESCKEQPFVRQLELIGCGDGRIVRAIKQYLKAFAQRSRWSRDGLLRVGELERYEQRLIDEWEIHFDYMQEELGEKATEDAKRKAALILYRWVETEADFPIRPRCTEPFVTRGSYHILADDHRVGWHPDFSTRLAALLESAAR